MKEGTICLKDDKTLYTFTKVGKKVEVYICGSFKGYGSLATPIDKLSLFEPAYFKISEKGYKTDPLKGILFEEVKS